MDLRPTRLAVAVVVLVLVAIGYLYAGFLDFVDPRQ